MYEEQEKLYQQCKDLYNINSYNYGLDIIDEIINKYDGNELFYKDKIDSLIKYLNINIENNIEKEKAYKCKAFLLYKDNQYEESIKYFNEIIAVPRYREYIYLFYLYIALCEYNLYKHEEALEYYNIAISKYEKSNYNNNYYIILHNNKANTLQILGRYDEAIKEYDKVINNMDINESKYVILNNKGYCLQKLGKWEEALKTYNDSIKAINDCKNYEAYCYRTIILEKLKKDNSEIENSFNKFLDIINNNLSNKNFQRSYYIFRLLFPLKNRLNNEAYEEIIDKMLANDFYIKIKCDIENLYNYTPININTIKSILNEQLWLSHTNSFNDPVDPSIKQFKKYKEDYDYLLDSIKVGCLTTKNDNTLMWSHYADKHRGICIEYDIGKINEKYNLIINKVNYNMPIITNKVNYSIPIITNKSIVDNETLEIDNIKRLIELFYTKSEEWKYEKEYRILYYDKERKKDGILIDCPIKSISFGTETSEDNKKLIRKIIKNKKGNKIEFKEAKFKQDKLFEINIEDYKAN